MISRKIWKFLIVSWQHKPKQHSVEIWQFSLTILREINFGESGVSKSAILTVSAPLKFGFSDFLQYLRAEIDQKSKFRASKIANI